MGLHPIVDFVGHSDGFVRGSGRLEGFVDEIGVLFEIFRTGMGVHVECEFVVKEFPISFVPGGHNSRFLSRLVEVVMIFNKNRQVIEAA